MINPIKKIFYIATTVLCSSAFLLNCEPTSDNLGEQFFSGTEGVQKSYDVVGYSITNNDSIKILNSELLFAPLGAFSESNFGMQKASYITQARLTSYDPDFGANAIVDSVVLVLKPQFFRDSATTVTDEAYIYPDGNVAAKKELITYPVSKYGKHKIGGNKVSFNLKVEEVTDFLGGVSDKYYSNVNVGTGVVLGTKNFGGNVSSVKITKDADNTTLYSHEASLRVPLDKSFFQNKIIAKKGSAELKDAASFIRYFKGLKVSVEEMDGYIFSFSPVSTEMIMYYKNDKVENNVTTRVQKTYLFNLGAGNVHVGQYQYNRTGTPSESIPMLPNSTTGDSKLYIQGMGGPSVGLKIPNETILELKDKFKNEKSSIISAKIRVYTDVATWSNLYEKPSSLAILQENTKSYLEDISTFAGNPLFNLCRGYDLDKNPAYYDFTITKSLKDIVELEKENKAFIINVGNFLTNANNQLIGYNVTGRPFTPNRMVMVGTDPGNPNRVQLNVTYGKK